MTQIQSEIKACVKLCNDYRLKLHKTAPNHRLLAHKVATEKSIQRRTFFDTFGPDDIQNLDNPTAEQVLAALKAYYAALEGAVAIEKARTWGKLS